VSSRTQRRNIRPHAAIALACLLVAGCAGEDERAARESDRARDESEQALRESTRIGDPLIVTNAPPDARRGLVEDEEPAGRGGLVQGAPSTDELDELPPAVGLGARSSGCRGASLAPTRSNVRRLEKPIRCLLNAERRSRGLGSLAPDRRLRTAANRHSGDMVARQYFAHRSPSGSDVGARARAAGWAPRNRSWIVGENIGWGSGSLATPAKMVDAWMASPGHRANVLRRSFREVGVAAVYGVPSGGDGATFTTVFGGRP
jgi:uncharacterized protein YkwD